MTRKEELRRAPHNGFRFARILPIIHITILLCPPSSILRHLAECESGERYSGLRRSAGKNSSRYKRGFFFSLNENWRFEVLLIL
jgi:hypothetical protein